MHMLKFFSKVIDLIEWITLCWLPTLLLKIYVIFTKYLLQALMHYNILLEYLAILFWLLTGTNKATETEGERQKARNALWTS